MLKTMEQSREEMRNIRLTLSYDGTNYHGWQIQPNGVSVEETLRAAVARILNHDVKLYAGGRTDAGVHAMGQVVNFFTPKKIAHDNLVRGLNSMLPPDIRIRESIDADPSFHARYSAKSKTYIYCVLNHPHNSPFLTRYVLHAPYSLDVPTMRGAIKHVAGEHDFSAFKKKNEAYKSTVREVKRAGIATKGRMVFVVIEATGFLRYMVRNIVGTLMLVGRGKMDGEGFRAVLEAGEREGAGPTAPPQGLFLREIKY
jgi:tRNA pseudouridine38-40 synthase